MNKFVLYPLSFILGVGMLTSCDDFFQPDTDDALKGDDYMSSLTEMTTGYLGILTKMQAVADKEIYLTDTRGEMLEPTDQSIAELIALYNYDDDLTDNSYANPAGYYDVVIACNDYINKMITFDKEYNELVKETEYFDGLLASALRVKAWAYMTLAEIYGQALWFDDPISSIKDVNDASIFTPMSAKQIVNKCITMLTNDVVLSNGKTVSPETDFSWIAWIDPANVSSIASSKYRFWDQMTPPHWAMMVKLNVWAAAYKDQAGEDATAEYEYVADMMLSKLHSTFVSNITYWKRGARTSGTFSNAYNFANPNQEESVSAIIFDYTKNQTNRLLYHFSNEYPNAYLLTSSEAGRARFSDSSWDPLGTAVEDNRRGYTTREYNGVWYISKFRPVGSTVRPETYQDDVHIYTFRIGEMYLWLAEALNHLNRFKALNHLMNTGFTSAQSDMLLSLENNETVDDEDLFQFKGFTSYWVNSKTGGTYIGFRNCMGVGNIEICDTVGQVHTLAEAHRLNDEKLANEWMFECACEGKVYPNLVRMAERYQDATIVSKRVTPKYATSKTGATEAGVKAKIEGVNPISNLPGYFVPWALK